MKASNLHWREFRKEHGYGSSPARQKRNLDRWMEMQERRRILIEGYHDHVRSPGEIVALGPSRTLGVSRGDSLRDPKQRPRYTHPALQRWKIREPNGR